MLRTLGWALMVVFLAVGGWWFYTHARTRSASSSGDVFSHNESADSKTDLDGNPTRDDPPQFTAPAPAIPAATPTATLPTQPAAITPQAPATPAAGLPTTDSIERNPPNGMAFGGGGKYQWYRQGNITWRIDTHSGVSCIDFATMDEWSKPIVYSHGCGRG